MKQMRVDMLVPAASVPAFIEEWFGQGITVDITVRKSTVKDKKILCLSVYGSTQEEIMAKIEAVESLIG